MNSGFPYRPPCNKDAPGAWPAVSLKSGGCFQHWRYSEAHRQKYENVTRALNWRCATEFPGVETTIPPYERPLGSPYGATGCSGTPPVWGDTTWCNTSHTKPPCGAWTRAEFAAACASGETRIDLNCYAEATGETVNLARCQKVGFKGVQSRKVWHGRYSFTSMEPLGCAGDSTPATPDQTKYLRVRRELSGTMIWSPEAETPTVFSLSYVREYLVNRYSGVITETAKTDTWTRTSGDEDIADPPSGISAMFGQVIACGLYGGSGASANPYNGPIDGAVGFAEAILKSTSVEATEAKFTLGSVEPGPGVTRAWAVDLSFTATLSTTYTAAALKSDAEELLEWWDLGNDKQYPWRRDLYTTVNPLVTYDEVPSPVNPDLATTAFGAAAYVDANSYDADDRPDGYTGETLGKPFEDGYPEARVSGNNGVEYFYGQGYGAECVLYHYGATVKTVKRYYWDSDDYVLAHTGVEDTDWSQETDAYGVTTVTILDTEWNKLACAAGTEDPEVAVGTCSGSHPDMLEVTFDYDWILGGHFDHRHTNHHWAGVPLADTIYYGAWSGGSGTLDPADACQPRTATQWADSIQASRFPHGAWTIMESGQGVLWMQKYAEIKLPWKSQNWFGPCGADRDRKTGYDCDLVDGACVQSGGTASWPNAWPIEGDRGATFAEAGGTVTVTLDAAAEYLRVGDKVDFTSADGLTVDDNSGAGYEVASIGSGTFTYAGAAPGATYTRVKSHGAPGYWWYDTAGKGSYSVIRHTFDHRAYALANPPATEDPGTMAAIERDCLSFNRCYPAVMCFSPNYDAEAEDSLDSFAHGQTYGFGTIVVDERYGSRWSGFFRQAMPDLWYKAPEVCSSPEDGCDGVGTYSEDEGGCTADDDTHTYYPHRPMVECLEVMPAKWNSEADALVPDLGLEEPTYTALAAVGPAEHVTTPDPTPEAQAPWVLWLNMQTCICAEGRWAEDGVLTTPSGYHYRGYENILGTWMCGAEPTVT